MCLPKVEKLGEKFDDERIALEKREEAATRIQSISRGRAVRRSSGSATRRTESTAQQDAQGAREARLAHLQQQ